MKSTLRTSLTLLSLLACITALGTLATVLFDAIAGVPGNVGTLGAWVVGALLIGQCRILWVLMTTRVVRPRPQAASTPLRAAQPLEPVQ